MLLKSQPVFHKNFTVLAIPLFSDNYAWLIHNNTQAWIVDPGDAEPISSILAKLNLRLAGMLITHSHWDHVNGIDDLLAQYTVPVYGYKGVHPKVTHTIQEGDQISLDDLEITVWHTPGHLADHVTYYADEPQWAFCGDTLFSAGCGRIKQTGNMAELETSIKRIGALPPSTTLFCSHEYTLNNLAFAQKVEPDNNAITEQAKHIQYQLANGFASLPCVLKDEQQYNPFLRLNQESVQSSLNLHTGKCLAATERFEALRKWKDVS